MGARTGPRKPVVQGYQTIHPLSYHPGHCGFQSAGTEAGSLRDIRNFNRNYVLVRRFILFFRSQRGEKRPDAKCASVGIASPLSSSRNNAAGRFSPRPKGAPPTRPGSVTA